MLTNRLHFIPAIDTTNRHAAERYATVKARQQAKEQAKQSIINFTDDYTDSIVDFVGVYDGNASPMTALDFEMNEARINPAQVSLFDLKLLQLFTYH